MLRKLFTCSWAVLSVLFACAQDIVITSDAKKIEAKVLEISETEIRYKEADDLEGPTYVISVPKVSSIVLSSGKVKVFGGNQPEVAQASVQKPQQKPAQEPVIVDTTAQYLTPELQAYLEGFPKNVVFVEGDYSMLYDKNAIVYFQFNYDDAEVVEYDHNDKHIESVIGSLKEYKSNHASDFEGFEISYFEKLACDKFNSSAKKKKCIMKPSAERSANQYLLNFHVEKMDLGSGVASVMSVNTGTTSGGVILSGKITIYDLATKEKVCTLYADRVKGIGSPHLHARIVNTLEELFGRQLFFIKKTK